MEDTVRTGRKEEVMAATETAIGSVWSLACARRRARIAQRETEATVQPIRGARKQDPSDSPLLHPDATEALVMAAAPLSEEQRPVAVVLEDGTVRSLHGGATGDRAFDTGQVSGP